MENDRINAVVRRLHFSYGPDVIRRVAHIQEALLQQLYDGGYFLVESSDALDEAIRLLKDNLWDLERLIELNYIIDHATFWDNNKARYTDEPITDLCISVMYSIECIHMGHLGFLEKAVSFCALTAKEILQDRQGGIDMVLNMLQDQYVSAR